MDLRRILRAAARRPAALTAALAGAFAVALLIVLAPPAAADDPRAAFYGIWGDAKQCAREPIIDGGSVRAAPFEIEEQWLRQGRIWCRITWLPVERRDGGAFTAAQAHCGEDSVQGYLIGMALQDETLTLRWDFPLIGPLSRCPIS